MSYKYQRVREQLRQAVEKGELAGKLPGERELARLYDANAKTINKALTDLATEGLVIRHVGRGTFVSASLKSASGPPGPPGGRSRHFGYLRAVEATPASGKVLLDQTREVLAARGYAMDEIGLSLGPNGELSGRDLRADRLRGYEGLVLCSLRPAEDLLAHVSRRHLPLVMVNNHHPQVRTAAVLPDYSQGAFELCQHLIQLGHERIRLVVDGACLPAAAAAEGGYQAAIQRFGARAFPSITIDPSSREDQLMEAVVGTQATAIVCAGARPAVILDRARRPDASDERMSIGCIPQAGDATAADAGLTAYETDPRQVAHGIAELLLSAAPARWQRVVVVPGKLTIRASTGPPAGRARDGIGGTPLP